jgi:hypothetical protein
MKTTTIACISASLTRTKPRTACAGFMYSSPPAYRKIVNQRRANRFRGASLALAAAFLALVAGAPGRAQAATIPFTFEVTYDSVLGGIPGPTTLIVPATNIGGSFDPFGSAIYTETGTVTFATLPSGDLVPSTISLNFTASFNGGADTFTGTDFHVFGVSETMTILGGTGKFTGATGFTIPTTVGLPPSGNTSPGFFATLATSGSGQIMAPELNATPEPATMALFGTGLAGLAGVAARRRRRQRVARE